MDMLATMSPEEYRQVMAQLRSEGLAEVSGDRNREERSNRRAEQILTGLR